MDDLPKLTTELLKKAYKKILPYNSHAEYVNRESALRGIQPAEFEKMIETELILIPTESFIGSAQRKAYNTLAIFLEASNTDHAIIVEEQSCTNVLSILTTYVLRGEAIKIKEKSV